MCSRDHKDSASPRNRAKGKYLLSEEPRPEEPPQLLERNLPHVREIDGMFRPISLVHHADTMADFLPPIDRLVNGDIAYNGAPSRIVTDSPVPADAMSSDDMFITTCVPSTDLTAHQLQFSSHDVATQAQGPREPIQNVERQPALTMITGIQDERSDYIHTWFEGQDVWPLGRESPKANASRPSGAARHMQDLRNLDKLFPRTDADWVLVQFGPYPAASDVGIDAAEEMDGSWIDFHRP